MSIRQVRELPARTGGIGGGESYVAKDVREFLRMGYDVAAVESPGRKANRVGAALKHYIKRNPKACAGVSAVQRGGVAYLVRGDVR